MKCSLVVLSWEAWFFSLFTFPFPLKHLYQLPTHPSVGSSYFPLKWFLSKLTSAEFLSPSCLNTLWLICTTLCSEQWAEASTDTAACKGLISYRQWCMRMSVGSAANASRPRAQKLLPLGLPSVKFWSWESGVKANISNPESGSHCQKHTPEHVVIFPFIYFKINIWLLIFFFKKQKRNMFPLVLADHLLFFSPLLLLSGVFAKWTKADFLQRIFHGLVSHQDDKSDWVPE